MTYTPLMPFLIVLSYCSISLADDVPQQQESQAAGADVALVKGFAPEQLIAAVERLLPPVTQR